MPIIIALGAAAVVVASYLVPLIITCVVSGVTIVATFFATRAFYKSDEQTNTELKNLQLEQQQRDAELRDSVSQVAQEIGIDVQALLNLSKAQQEEFKQALSSFLQNIDTSAEVTEHVHSLASSIHAQTNTAEQNSELLHQELSQMREELQHVYTKLHITEQNLAVKEQELQETIAQLSNLGEQLAASGLVQELNSPETLATLRSALGKHQQDELHNLRSKNVALAAIITKLQQTVTNLEEQLAIKDSNEKLQIEEIQKLIVANQELTKTIESLAESLEDKTSKINQEHTPKLRLFG